MPELITLGPWLRRFLCEHIATERNLARNTRQSYRDSFSLLLPFVSRKLRKPVDRLAVRDLTQYEEFLQVRDVQQQVWGFSGGEGLYPPVLNTAAENGGTVIGALIIGFCEVMAIQYIDPLLSDVIPFVVLIAFLIVRPWGLFGTREELDRV